MSGFVQIHRSIMGHHAFRNDAEAMAFAWMIARAAWKATKVRYKNRIIPLQRGQLAISVRDMAAAMDRDKAWVDRLWKRLKKEDMVQTVGETHVTIITICNYDDYQKKSETGETAAERKVRQGRDTEQEGEELEEENTPPTPSGGTKGKTKISEDWVLPAICDLPPKARACAEKWTRESYETHGEAFVSYWRSNGRMMADWRLTWANRIVALHGQVMRDQKFGNAPVATIPAASDTERIKALESMIAVYERSGRESELGPIRRELATLKAKVEGIAA